MAHRREQTVLGNFLHLKSLSSTGSPRPVRPWLNRNETHPIEIRGLGALRADHPPAWVEYQRDEVPEQE